MKKHKNPTTICEFKVASVSTNANSFGLYGHVIVNRSGEAYEIAMNYLNKCSANDTYKALVSEKGNYLFPNAELPTRLGNAPQKVVQELFKSD